MKGILFDDKHSFKDFGLILMSVVLPNPDPKIYEIEIPGANGTLDLSEVLGGVKYNSREITITFAFSKENYNRYDLNSKIANILHGKKMKIIFDDDPSYFYLGRVNFNEWVVDKSLGLLTFTVMTDPYKYEILSTLDNWTWNNFNFNTGIIKTYKNIKVTGRLEKKIIGTPKVVIPEIISDSDLIVEWEGKQYNIKPGNNKMFGITINDGEHIMVFIGNGTISINYRGGRL